MNRQEFLEAKVVENFINWLIPRISGEIKFLHQYENLRGKTIWNCDSIYNAYENYNWRFNCNIPELGKISGSSFNESAKALKKIEEGLKSALKSRNHEKIIEFSVSILEWGGVKRTNYEKLTIMNNSVIDYFETAIEKLNPLPINTNNDFTGIIMNSGFTKIYSLLIDGFVIYDSRVGAALGLLVKLFLVENQLDFIPKELEFAYGNARPTKSDKSKRNRRNPSNEIFRFPVLRNDDKLHIINNVKANWLLKEVSEKSQFRNELSPIRALESALFMIGYSVN